jgi:hypothetical protein
MVWPTEVSRLTSVGLEADGSYHFLGNFCRSKKADEDYLTSIGSVDEIPSAYSRRKLGQNRQKKLIYVGLSLTSIDLWPTEVSVLTVVYACLEVCLSSNDKTLYSILQGELVSFIEFGA